MAINLNEMSADDMRKLAEQLEKQAAAKEVMENSGLNENSFAVQAFRVAERIGDSVIFEIKVENAYGTNDVRNVLINGFSPYNASNKSGQYLPDNFVEDLKSLQVKEFALTGVVPVRLIKELQDMGCKFDGFMSDPVSDAKEVLGLGSFFGLTTKFAEKTEEGRKLGKAVKKVESAINSNLNFDKEPRLCFTIEAKEE